MMKKTHDLLATVGEYTDASGEKKKRRINVGAVFTDEDGRVSVKLESVPVGGGWSGWLSGYEVDRTPRSRPAAKTAPSADDGDGDDIPF